jgi:hypothetical protein
VSSTDLDCGDDDEAILRRFGFEPDPVVEAYKKDVDRTLLRANLRRSPEERWRNILAAYRLAEEVRRAGAVAREPEGFAGYRRAGSLVGRARAVSLTLV